MEATYQETLSHYLLFEKVGAGGMGQVFLAKDTRLGRKVALKLLSPEFTGDHERVLRFKQEAKAVSALNHPNIITIYDIGETDSIHFIATEFVDGETLRQRLTKGTIRVRDAVDIAIQVAGALSAAHRAGIIHRDIKPENLMQRSDGYVKVLDFGLAKLNPRKMPFGAAESAISRLVDTQTGLLIGTPQYMSPEQVRGLAVDHRSDIFSLGLVLYEIVAGKNPFRAATVSDTIASILNLESSPISEVVLGVPKYLEGILQKMLQKDADDRYGSMDEVILDLKTLSRYEGFEAAAIFPFQDKVNTSLSDQVTQPMSIAEVTPMESVPRSGVAMEPLKTARSLVSRYRSKLTLLSLLAIVVFAAAPIWIYKAFLPPATNNEAPISVRTYQQMTDQEQSRFVKERAEKISAMLGANPKPLSDAAVDAIKSYVDSYAVRANSLQRRRNEGFGDGLRVIYGRASQYAPVIIREFKADGVPPVVGLYIPMLEAEYGACLQSPTGPIGPFQLTTNQARSQNLDPAERCDIEKTTPAAARYISDLESEFGSDSDSMTLVVLSFSSGPDSVRSYLRELHSVVPSAERSNWGLLDNADKLNEPYKDEVMKYVPKFYAAAIVFENPESFGMPQRPLSTITE